jgi:hypothetical protein
LETTMLSQNGGHARPHLGKKLISALGDGIMSTFGAGSGCDSPFVGLRPFGYIDRKFFFGREKELDVLESQVKENRFVAVLGRTGAGKSSLVSAGLRSRLENDPDNQWCWVEARPADAPIRGLAVALASLTGETGDRGNAWVARIERVLTRSTFGIGESLALIPSSRKLQSHRVLLFIDQFEELFRFAGHIFEMDLDLKTGAARRDDAIRFVRLLLTATAFSRLPIHIIVGIRSDFAGECARFYGLPEAVSENQFLVPCMTRDQREDVIRRPIEVADGVIDADLVQQALNDTSDDPNQLPNLQRAMMGAWERAYFRDRMVATSRPHLTIDDYARRYEMIEEIRE